MASAARPVLLGQLFHSTTRPLQRFLATRQQGLQRHVRRDGYVPHAAVAWQPPDQAFVMQGGQKRRRLAFPDVEPLDDLVHARTSYLHQVAVDPLLRCPDPRYLQHAPSPSPQPTPDGRPLCHP